jgi:hypothetical protein
LPAAIISAALISMGSVAQATSYDEATSGDLSNNAASPTSIGSLSLGDNVISGATIPSGPLNPITHSRSVVDNDYVTFVVPTGRVLSAVDVETGTILEPTDRMFFGIANGSDVYVDPSFTSAKGLLGWTLVNASAVGTNVLPALGLSAPPNFPAIPGATGFSGSLGAGPYTILLLDGDSPATYKLDLVVSNVPEPSTIVCAEPSAGSPATSTDP